ncbi:hypothetical protein OIV83_005383 [Microbotryomycetes sp. JL201]|nr:hypothetical protein OIV83_005383 [Microbotryomycetes sp. JL201]
MTHAYLITSAPEGRKRQAVEILVRYHTFVASKLNFNTPKISVFVAVANQIMQEPLTGDFYEWTTNRDLQMLRLERIRWIAQLEQSYLTTFARGQSPEFASYRAQKRMAKAFVDSSRENPEIFTRLVVPAESIDFAKYRAMLDLFKKRELLEIEIAHILIDVVMNRGNSTLTGKVTIDKEIKHLVREVADVVTAGAGYIYESWLLLLAEELAHEIWIIKNSGEEHW